MTFDNNVVNSDLVTQCLVSGNASGELLFSHAALSFWGGVDLVSGNIIDQTHPLHGASITGRVLAIPSGRGSCTGSGALLELLLNGRGPVGLIFQHPDHILAMGALVGRTIFNLTIPVVVLSPSDFAILEGHSRVNINGDRVSVSSSEIRHVPLLPRNVKQSDTLKLSFEDEAMLRGDQGHAKRVAMEILADFTRIQGAERLINVTQAHIDACIYIGPAGLHFAQHLVSLGAKFSVPTTLNAVSVDRRRWRELGVTQAAAQPAEDLAKAYMTMGARMSFTCAPYLLDTAPQRGEQIGWAESNAVVFANSILGARTQKYPDFLDVCIAITGRAPLAGCHRDQDRLPTLAITIPALSNFDDSLYPVLGYHIGKLAGSAVPLVYGLENATPSIPDLKAFGAGFATTSSASIFHLHGITPEASQMDYLRLRLRQIDVSLEELIACQYGLNTALTPSVELVSLGNPHFSIEEFAELARHCSNHIKHPRVAMIVTTSRSVQEAAGTAGYLEALSRFGAEVITDTCWCMIDEPIISSTVHNLMTNSAKYAHYAPGIARRGVHFGSLAQCIDAACEGEFKGGMPLWAPSDVSEDWTSQ